MQISLFDRQIGPLSDATIPGQSGPGNDGNEGVRRIPQSCSITRTSPSDCLVSYTDPSLGGVFPLCRDIEGVFYNSSQQGKINLWIYLTTTGW